MNILQSIIALSLMFAGPVDKKLDPRVMSRAKADLTCSIHVSTDPEGMHRVSDGGQLVAAGGNQSLYVHVALHNKGLADAKATGHAIAVKRNAQTVESKRETLAIPAGLSKLYAPIRVPMMSTSNALKVSVVTDTNGLNREFNEKNNRCTFNFNYTIAH